MLGATAASVQTGFHPKQLETGGVVLRAWFDLRDPTTYDVTAGRIVTIRNKVTGAAFVEQSSSGPLLVQDFNGGPAMLANGSSNFLAGTEAALLQTWAANAGDQTHTLVHLYKHVGGAPYSVGSTTENFDDSSWTGTGYNRSDGGTVTWLGDQTVGLDAHAQCIRYRGSALDPQITLDSTHQTVSVASGTPPKAIASPDQFVLLAIGRAIKSSFFSGRLAQVIIYSGIVTDAQAIQATTGVRNWYGYHG